MVEKELQKPIVIADKEAKHYAWVLILELQRHDGAYLHAVDKNMGTVESLVRTFAKLGVEERYERKRVWTVNDKNGKRIEVWEVRLEKIGALKD